MLDALDFAEVMKFFGSCEVIREFVPDGAADAYDAGEFGVGVSKGDIFGKARDAGKG